MPFHRRLYRTKRQVLAGGSRDSCREEEGVEGYSSPEVKASVHGRASAIKLRSHLRAAFSLRRCPPYQLLAPTAPKRASMSATEGRPDLPCGRGHFRVRSSTAFGRHMLSSRKILELPIGFQARPVLSVFRGSCLSSSILSSRALLELRCFFSSQLIGRNRCGML